MNILLIEDDQLLRKAMGHNLMELGHSVSSAGNGQEAIDTIEKNRNVDLIICDVMMPVLTGPSFILMLKKYFPHTLPSIIAISGMKDGESFVKKIDMHYDYFLSKPIDFERLKEAIRRIEAIKRK